MKILGYVIGGAVALMFSVAALAYAWAVVTLIRGVH